MEGGGGGFRRRKGEENRQQIDNEDVRYEIRLSQSLLQPSTADRLGSIRIVDNESMTKMNVFASPKNCRISEWCQNVTVSNNQQDNISK